MTGSGIGKASALRLAATGLALSPVGPRGGIFTRTGEAPAEGFKVAMRTLGVFCPPAAAALGFARGASSGQRNCFLSILPTEVRGKASTNTIWRGTL